MKHLMSKLFRVLPLLLVFVAVPAFAQTATTQTTLSTAINGTATSFTLASVTGIAAGSEVCFADAPDCRLVTAVSGTTVTATPGGVDGTRQAAHPAGAIVFASAAGAPSSSTASPFIHGSPTGSPTGNSCTRTSQQLLPLYDVDTGNIWDCYADNITSSTLVASGNVSAVGRWRATSLTPTDGSVAIRVPVNNVDYQIKAWDYLVVVTSLTNGTTGGHNLTLPSATGMIGKQIVIKDEGGFANGANPVLTVVGTIDGQSNVVINSAYSVMRLESNGNTWFRW